jgi:chromosome segregation ATPase
MSYFEHFNKETELDNLKNELAKLKQQYDVRGQKFIELDNEKKMVVDELSKRSATIDELRNDLKKLNESYWNLVEEKKQSDKALEQFKMIVDVTDKDMEIERLSKRIREQADMIMSQSDKIASYRIYRDETVEAQKTEITQLKSELNKTNDECSKRLEELMHELSDARATTKEVTPAFDDEVVKNTIIDYQNQIEALKAQLKAVKINERALGVIVTSLVRTIDPEVENG